MASPSTDIEESAQIGRPTEDIGLLQPRSECQAALQVAANGKHVQPLKADEEHHSFITEVVSSYTETLRFEGTLVRLLLVLAVNGLLNASFLTFLPIYVKGELRSAQSFTGFYRTVSLVLMASAPICMGFINCAGPKLNLLLGMMGTAISGLVFLEKHPGLILLVSAACQGALDGVFQSSGKTYMVVVARPARLGVATALYFVGQTLGAGIGSAMGGAILFVASFQTLGIVMFAGSIPLLISAGALLPAAQAQLQDSDVVAAQSPEENKRMGILASSRHFVRIFGRRQVWTLAAWQSLRTVFWGAATLTMPFLLHRYSQNNLVVGVFQLVSNVCAVTSMLVMGAVSDTEASRRKQITVWCLGLLAVASAVLAAAVFAQSTISIFVVGTLATPIAWTISGQVTPLAREMAESDEEGLHINVIISAWALGALGGAQMHGWLSEAFPGAMFAILAVILAVAHRLALWMFAALEEYVPPAKPTKVDS